MSEHTTCVLQCWREKRVRFPRPLIFSGKYAMFGYSHKHSGVDGRPEGVRSKAAIYNRGNMLRAQLLPSEGRGSGQPYLPTRALLRNLLQFATLILGFLR